MKIIKTNIPDVLIFEPKIFGDERGYFFESFRQDVFEEAVGKVNFVQDNQSKSSYGVLRGLHFQRPPYAQSKLVRCLKGEVLDVAVDIRLGSPTYGKHVAVRLNDIEQRQLWIPQGFAHGFLVLSESAIFAYKCDNYYTPEYDGGVRWDDTEININWELSKAAIKLSDKDKIQPFLKDANYFTYEKFRREIIY